ncbi:MAG: hypothetical protein LBE38_08910 [Deltaproteobacteria bacterium]|jgi:MraZ protein|nr:hypothetical protein [Deltaproteobacteria bacterium]
MLSDLPNIFSGTHYHSLDEKGRLTLPGQFKKVMEKADQGDWFYLGFMPGTRHLNLYTKDRWKKAVEEWSDPQRFSSTQEFMTAQRLFFANIEKVTLDKAGRILIPQHQRERCNIEREVVILGLFDKIEIWDPSLRKLEEDEEQKLSKSLFSEDRQKDGSEAPNLRLPAC